MFGCYSIVCCISISLVSFGVCAIAHSINSACRYRYHYCGKIVHIWDSRYTNVIDMGKHTFPILLYIFFIFNQNFHVEYTITISNRVSVYYYDTYIIAKPLCYHCISQKIGLSLFLGVFFISFLFISIIFLKQFSLVFLLLELICSHRYRFSSKHT